MRAPATDNSSDGRWRPLRCPVRPQRDELWVAPEGELDLASVGELRAVLAEHLDSGFERLVLDLRGLTFIDSTGLRAVLAAGRTASARGVEFVVRPGPSQVQRIFELTGTAGLIRTG